MGARSAAGLADIEVSSIGVVSKDTVSGTIGDAVVRIDCAVVEELVDAGGGGFCGSDLLEADFDKGMQEFVVADAGIVQDGAEDSLELFDYGVV